MKKRSKRFLEAKKKIVQKEYAVVEAIDIAKEVAPEKFDASLEVHIRLGIDVGKSEQNVKGTVNFPHGTGKKVKCAVFVADEKIQQEAKAAGAEMVGGENLIKKIKQTKKCNFDVALATPEMMRLLAQVAKILGPRGLMPNPKIGTVTADPIKILKELQSGRVNFKNDPAGIIHRAIGKISFPTEKLAENYRVLLEAVNKARPEKMKGEYIRSITLCSSMGPGIKVK